jgi:hypothetical protein
MAFLLLFYDIYFPVAEILQTMYSFKGKIRFRKRVSPNQITSDDTQSRRHSDTKPSGDTASSDNAEGSSQTIRSPVALDIEHPLSSLVDTDSEAIQAQGQDAKDTRALLTPVTGLRDSDGEEISTRIQAIENSAVAFQIRFESAGGQALMQEIHAEIRNIQTYLVPQDGQGNFRSEQKNRRHTYLTIGVQSPVYTAMDLSLTRLEALMSRLIPITSPSATEVQAGERAAANLANQQQNTALEETRSSQSHAISEFSFHPLMLNLSMIPNLQWSQN